jgi:integrase
MGVRLDKMGLLFPAAPWTPNVPRNPDLESGNFHKAAVRMGFAALRFHDLRHTHATLMLAGGASPKAVSQRLGHSDIAITLRVYGHVLASMDQQATAIAAEMGL